MARKKARTAEIAESKKEPRLVPEWLFEGMFFVALVMPNLIFSGSYWFQTLHLMKWFLAMVPVAVVSAVAGWRLLRQGPEATGFRLDPFGAAWFLLLAYALIQPLWAPVTSAPTLVREWLYMATLFGAYLWTRREFKGDRLPLFLLAIAVNSAANILFAELQIRNLSGSFPFILPTPGHYIGNTGQQNMFGVWIAIALYGGAFLHLAGRIGPKLKWVNLALFAVNAWGLWNTTSRSAYLSFFVGLATLCLVYGRLVGRRELRRLLALALILVATFFAVNHYGRGGSLINKAIDMVENVQTVGNRDSIWLTSWYMFRKHPVTGVGLGHYKWNYLDAQRDMLQDRPDKAWKFTLWAHSEVIQWFCEFGLPGGLFLLALGGWWLYHFLRALIDRRQLSLAALWAVGLLFLFWFDALWTRPFHRIENVLWMSLAFALANRELLPEETVWSRIGRPPLLRAFGGLALAVSVGGMVLMADAMVGDRKIAVAMASRDVQTQRTLLEEAHRHLLVRDLARKQLAYHYIALAEQLKDRELLLEGILRIEEVFRREPHSKELSTLLKWEGKLGRKEALVDYVTFLKPGTYRIRSSGESSVTSQEEMP
ncbi:MAG: O-antigen ligase family protein [Synergistaceae bacterium]|nr:O-antigen ligase family protein [Synergistaceae bacterium]